MNRKLLLFCVLSTFCLLSRAQYESAVADENTSLSSKLSAKVVRNWNQYNISVHQNDSVTFFVLTDFAEKCLNSPSPTTFNARVSQPFKWLRVHDMCIYSDRAYICGTYVTFNSLGRPDTSYGIIGRFDLNDLLSGTTLHIDFNMYDSIRWFYKIVAYEDDYGVEKAVVLGNYRHFNGDHCEYYSTLVEDAFGAYPPGYNCIEFPDYSPSITNISIEEMHDLVLMQKELLVIGVDDEQDSNCGIIIRKADKNDVIGSLFAFPQLYKYVTNVCEVNHPIVATRMHEEDFAVSYNFFDDITNRFYTRIRVIDYNSMDMRISQHIHLYGKEYPFDIKFDSINKILVMMHGQPFTIDMPLTQTYFALISPYQNGYYDAPVLFNGHLFASSCIYAHQYYVSVGINRWYFQYTMPVLPTSYDCPRDIRIKVEEIPIINKRILDAPTTHDILSFQPLSLTAPVYNSMLNLICHED